VRVLDVDGNLVLHDSIALLAFPLVVLQLLAMLLEVFDELQTILAKDQANRALIFSRAASCTNNTNVIDHSEPSQELAVACFAVKVIRFGVHFQAIVVSTRMRAPKVFNHFRVVWKHLLTYWAFNLEHNRSSNVQMLRLNVLRKIVLRREAFVVEVTFVRSYVEMSPGRKKQFNIT
jgi:hypothetical protein